MVDDVCRQQADEGRRPLSSGTAMPYARMRRQPTEFRGDPSTAPIKNRHLVGPYGAGRVVDSSARSVDGSNLIVFGC